MGDIGEIIPDRELSTYILRGLIDSWESFIQILCGHSRMPKYDRLWADCSKEEARLVAKHGNSDDENQALAACFSHQKGKKKFIKKYYFIKYYSKVQCFGCKELGHIKRDFPKEKGKQREYRVEVDDDPLSKKSRDEHSSYSHFLLLSSLSGIVQTNRDT